MKLIEDRSGYSPKYFVITGEGRTELNVMRGLTQVYNGQELTLFFPLSSSSRRTGIKALNSIKRVPEIYGINSIIYIVDGDVFEGAITYKISNYLNSIGVDIEKVNSIQDAFLLNCRYGHHKIELFCIISGPTTFIEEEIAKLLSIKYGLDIDLSGMRDYEWKEKIKKVIKYELRERKVKIENLIKQTGKKKLEIAFPNFCAVLKWIENKTKVE